MSADVDLTPAIARPQTGEPSAARAARLHAELLTLSVNNAALSVPTLTAAALYFAYLAHGLGESVGAVLAAIVGAGIGAWRWSLARRYPAPTMPARAQRCQRELEFNALAAGLLWGAGAWLVYPRLQGLDATLFLMIVCGSVSMAALFMSLAGRAFPLLAVPQLGALMAVSALDERVRSIPLALLVPVFGVAMMRGAEQYRSTATRSINHRLAGEEAHESLRRAKEAAEAASRAKSEFLAMMSHEIRTPMNGVLGALELLRRSALDTRQRRLVRTASMSGATLMAILNDVLDQSKIEAGKLTLQPAPMSLHALALSVVALFRPNAEARGIGLELQVDPGTPDHVIGDPQRLQQVLSNLVGNAVKFTERGAVVLRLSPHEDGTRFEVSDTGIGIASDRLDRLFDPFFQVDGTRRRQHGGTGLGLSISQHIVQAMGGHIEVASYPGRGSVFRFTLPLPEDPSPPTPLVQDSQRADLDGQPSLSGTVLLVEDNAVNRLIAHEMLVAMGLGVVEAVNGLEAVQLAHQGPVDLVLMDCQMPELDGYQATQRIRADEAARGLPRVPILALTADAFAEDAQRAHAAGMDGHLAKPFTQAQLRALLEAWL